MPVKGQTPLKRPDKKLDELVADLQNKTDTTEIFLETYLPAPYKGLPDATPYPLTEEQPDNA